jgi:hypothetical protein
MWDMPSGVKTSKTGSRIYYFYFRCPLIDK